MTRETSSYPTRPFDLVKEAVIALLVVSVLSLALAAVFSSPDEKSITMSDWANAASADVVKTAATELAGTSTSATLGPPYNHADAQKIGPLQLQKWAGVQHPVDSADLVLQPLRLVKGDVAVSDALATWDATAADKRTSWASDYADALDKAPDGDPAKAAPGDYGPVPQLTASFLGVAKGGGLEGALTSSGNFYGGDQTRSLLLLSDSAYLEDTARAENLGGNQWGMMNETGNYPGQPWMWLYTFWYQVEPFSSSGNADALVWGLMVVLTVGLAALPWIPGLRDIPRWVPVHRLIWRQR